MTKDEALRMALEALDDYKYAEARTIIREALAQPEGCQCPACKITPHESDCAVHNAPAYPVGKCDCGAQAYPDNFIDALKYDVAKRDSEARLNLDPTPISGWGQQSIGMAVNQSDHRLMENAQGDLERINLVQTGVGIGQPEQEPVKACVTGQCPCKSKCDSAQHCLYTSPPPRKPLSDEDLRKLADKHLFYQPEGYEVSGVFALARAIEAAHGIKE